MGQLINLEDLNEFKNQLFNAIFPVGSIYTSVNSTNPSSLFGGTWEQLKDRFLLGAGDTYSNGATGGNATHTHGLSGGYATVRGYQGNILISQEKTVTWTPAWKVNIGSESEYGYSTNAATGLGGSTDSGSTLPPYLVVYMWKRTA